MFLSLFIATVTGTAITTATAVVAADATIAPDATDDDTSNKIPHHSASLQYAAAKHQDRCSQTVSTKSS